MNLRIVTLWTDSDEMLEVEVSASAGATACRVQIYVYPQELASFGEALANYTGVANSGAVLELGSPDPGRASWLRIEAYPIDGVGHSALEVRTKTNGTRHVQTASHFSSVSEVANINRLGAALQSWAHSGEREFSHATTAF
jgi:hypothetical protein